MTRQEAIAVIKELVRCEIDSMKQEYSRKNGVTKKLQDEEFRAVRAVFFGLTGSMPANEEVDEMLP
jgi:hypothetical protein